MDEAAPPLREAWYYAVPSRALRRGKTLPKLMLGEPVLLGRDRGGRAVRRSKISARIAACRFPPGALAAARSSAATTAGASRRRGYAPRSPRLPRGRNSISTAYQPARLPGARGQRQYLGLFWQGARVSPGDPALAGFVEDAAPQVRRKRSLRCRLRSRRSIRADGPRPRPRSSIGSWFWRSGRDFVEKEKSFEPSPHGFTMKAGPPPSRNSRGYKLLGAGAMETRYRLYPGRARGRARSVGRHSLCNMTAMTPIDDDTVELNNCIYWTMPWLSALQPGATAIHPHFSRPGSRCARPPAARGFATTRN